MTIKQQGGIFGRNPTFNDVEVEGSLTVGGSSINTVGTMASQDADSVNITGGSIDISTGTLTLANDQISGDTIDGGTITPDNVAVGVASTTYPIEARLTSSTAFDGTLTPWNNSSNLTLWNLSTTSGTGPVIQMASATGSGQRWYIGLDGNSGFTSDLVFANRSSSSVVSERLQVKYDGNIVIPSGNLVIGTSGNGIDFSATAGTGTSELFDDYEEGQHTATVTPQTSGTITLFVNTDELSYTKVGRLVSVTGHLSVESVASPVGNFVTISLPFAIGSLDEASGDFVGSGGTNASGSWLPVLIRGNEGDSDCDVYFDASTLSSGKRIEIGITYHTS